MKLVSKTQANALITIIISLGFLYIYKKNVLIIHNRSKLKKKKKKLMNDFSLKENPLTQKGEKKMPGTQWRINK